VLRIEGYDLTEIESITGIHRKYSGQDCIVRARSLARHLEQQTGAASVALLIGSNS
jgi:hypothetical protein